MSIESTIKKRITALYIKYLGLLDKAVVGDEESIPLDVLEIAHEFFRDNSITLDFIIEGEYVE